MSQGPPARRHHARSAHPGLAARRLAGIAAELAILTTCGVARDTSPSKLEFALTMAMNSLAGSSLLLDRVEQVLTVSQLPQGVGLLWCTTDDADARARLLRDIAAACAIPEPAAPASTPAHPHPLRTEALGFVMPAEVEPETLNHFEFVPQRPWCRLLRPGDRCLEEPSQPGTCGVRMGGNRRSRQGQGSYPSAPWARAVSPAGREFVPPLDCPLPGIVLQWNKSTDRGSIRRSCSPTGPCSPMAFLLTYQVATLPDDFA